MCLCDTTTSWLLRTYLASNIGRLEFWGLLVQELDAAVKDFEAALKAAPEDKAVKAELARIKRQQHEAEAKLRGTFKRMFG